MNGGSDQLERDNNPQLLKARSTNKPYLYLGRENPYSFMSMAFLFVMDFKENDLVVVKGYKKDASSTRVLADIFDVLFVGLHELVLIPRTKFGRVPFKIEKDRCVNLKMIDLEQKQLPPIKLGDLVLGFDVEFNGDIKNKKVGHVSEIIVNPNAKKYYMITSKNTDTMFEEDKVLLLQ